MSLRETQQQSAEIRLPADVDWQMLDKSKFFLFGAALFSGVSATLYPVVVLKTRQQVSASSMSSCKLAVNILRHEGFCGLYRGFGTSLLGTIPARALYMSALEITKSSVAGGALQVGFSEPAAAAVANAAAGISASVAAQIVWTPIDVISQRLMVQSKDGGPSATHYKGGFDAFRTILRLDGWQGLYRGFGMSILTYAPSNALWWTSYCLAQRFVWRSLGYCQSIEGNFHSPSHGLVVGVQAASAACAGGVAAVITTPLDTIKTRLQVMQTEEKRHPTVIRTVKTLFSEGGWRACYKGLGPRWATMSMSATTMITTYEFLKRMSTKQEHTQVS